MVIVSWHCAVKGGQLEGGERDETPPVIIQEKSTPNFQTHFSERTIILNMDEWVKLEKAYTQVLISPPLEKRPDINVKGRGVVIEFHDEEVLRENATYSINFGESIQDITESNPLKNFSFVFSTGDAIDSLRMTGIILDAYTGEPVENALIMVYEEHGDSIVFQEKPFYAARSEEDGSYQIGNMKAGSFKVVAVMDENLNYLYDPAAESIAFLGEPIQPTENGLPPVELMMSKEKEQLYLAKKDTSGWNLGIFTYNRPPEHLKVEIAGDSTFHNLLDQDLYIWYHAEQSQTWAVYLEDTLLNKIDTISLRWDAPPAPTPHLEEKSRIKNTGHPRDPFTICFDMPITSFDTSRIITIGGERDTVQPDIAIIDSLPLCLIFEHAWSPDSLYQITLFPGALTDIYGLTNDTIAVRYPIGNTERFGNIELLIDSLSPDQAYLIELMLKDKAEVALQVADQKSLKRTISKLKPGEYELRITEDKNQNGRWDPAAYLEGQQPELTIKATIEKLRANWDVEAKYIWKGK